jgi:hypothetical protein
MEKKPQKSAGRKADSGNVTVIDFGEKHHQKIDRMINEKLAAAGVSMRTEMSGKGAASEKAKAGAPASIGSSRIGKPFMGRPGNVLSGYRPGGIRERLEGRPSLSGRPGFGRSVARPGFGRPSLGARPGRPWFQRYGNKPWMGQEVASVPSGRTYLIPASVQTVKTAELLTGGALGVLGNRALVKLTPMMWGGQKPLVYEGIAFVVGLLPLAFKRNATTLGVALPGAVFLTGTLVDMLFNWLMPAKVAAPATAAGTMQGGQDATWAARQKLAQIQNRINQPQMAAQGPLPRVVARAQ